MIKLETSKQPSPIVRTKKSEKADRQGEQGKRHKSIQKSTGMKGTERGREIYEVWRSRLEAAAEGKKLTKQGLGGTAEHGLREET